MSPPAAFRLAPVAPPGRARRDGGLCPPWLSPIPSQGIIVPASPCPPPELPRPFPDRRSEVAFPRFRDRIESS